MRPQIERAFICHPLDAVDVENDLDLLEGGEKSSEARKAAHGTLSILTSAGWSICSAMTIFTAKQLMTTHAFHYPFTIAFRAFTTALIVCVMTNILRNGINTLDELAPRWSIRRLESGRPWIEWATMLPAALAAAVAFPTLLQGILHLPSLSLIVMLIPAIYGTESFILLICCSTSKPRKRLLLDAISSATTSCIIIYNENRLEIPGLLCTIISIILVGLSRASLAIGSERLQPSMRTQLYGGFYLITLLLGMIISGVLACSFEHISSFYPATQNTRALIIINALAFVATALLSLSIGPYSPGLSDENEPYSSEIPDRSSGLFLAAGAGLLVLCWTTYFGPFSLISWVQISTYIASMAFLAGANQIYMLVLPLINSVHHSFDVLLGKDTFDHPKPGRLSTFGVVLFLFLFAVSSWSLSALASVRINFLPSGLPAKLDVLYQASSRFDIVVSMYHEDPLQVKMMIDEIKATKPLADINPRTIIYTKNPSADLSEIQRLTGADILHRLDNLGREGGTYLWHIVHQWNDLAEQTMFVQAHAHNMRELIPRINSYLVPQTGMLSLGFVGITCSCDRCGDRFGWEDKWDIVPSLYQHIYSQPCTPSTPPILISYKGQFVASARRIHGIGRDIYATLLATITSVDGWSHNQTVIGDVRLGGGTGIDSPDNPYFGFTVERVWGLLMQCATDTMVTTRCPSLLSGSLDGIEIGNMESAGDCGCLDSE